MKKLQNQLMSIAKSLAKLSQQVENVSGQIAKVQPAKSAPAKKAAPKKKTVKKAAPKKAADKKLSVIDKVYAIVSRSRKGADMTTLRQKTGFGSRQLSNALYKLAKRGKIESKARGLYVKKSPAS